MTSAELIPDLTQARRRGLVFVVLAGVLWSTVGLGIRMIETAGVWQILFYRSISLTGFLFVVLWLRSGRLPLAQIRAAGPHSVIAGLALVAAYAGGIYAIQTVSVANALLLFAAAPFMAALLGWLVLGETVRRATLVAILAAGAGIAIMVSDKSAGGALAGNLAALGSAFGFAVFTVALRWGRTGEMLPSVLLSGLFAIAITGAICLGAGLPLILSASDASVALGMGVFQVGAGLVFYTLGSKTVPAAELALLSMAEVLLAPFWVWLFLGESAAPTTLIGGAVLLAAIAGNAATGLRRKPPPITTP